LDVPSLNRSRFPLSDEPEAASLICKLAVLQNRLYMMKVNMNLENNHGTNSTKRETAPWPTAGPL
jgi:hypothetical protein